MRSQYNNLMSIDQFAEIAMIDPFHLAGWCITDIDSGCDCDRETYVEYQYQNKYLSRQEISLAIETAERMIHSRIGTFVAPQAVVNEVRRYPQPQRNKRSHTTRPLLARSTMVTSDGKRYKSINAKYGFIQAIGLNTDTLVGETASIDFDNNTERFKATIDLLTVPVANESYVIYFNDDDRQGDPLNEWEVRPVQTSVNGTILTITGESYLLMLPKKRRGRKWSCLQADKNTNFSQTILVYKRILDTTNHGTLQWGSQPCTEPNGCNDTIIKATCLQRDDHELHPMLRPQPMSYNDVTSEWERYSVDNAPDFALINYIAGIPRTSDGRVADPLAKAVFYLAASLLKSDTPECGCDDNSAKVRLSEFRDVEKTKLKATDENTRQPMSEERPLVRPKHLDSNWGGKYGAVRAMAIVTEFLDSLRF